MPSLTKGVGIVSQITYTGTRLENNFNSGLGNAQWDRVVCDKVGYDAAALAGAVAALNANPKVGLIVTVGGCTTAVAALNYSANLTKPFISLIGDTITEFPGTITTEFWGGINLNANVGFNSKRFTNLTTDHGFLPGEICLLCNPKSATTKYEKANWEAATPPRGPIYYAETMPEIQAKFQAFRQNGALRAMIISSDGFFQDNRRAIIDEHHKPPIKFVCYPVQRYAQDTGRALPHLKSRRHGPKLATAYHYLGKMAADVINNGTPSTLKSLPPGDIEKNDD
jgi:hypothetical protein